MPRQMNSYSMSALLKLMADC